MEKCVHLDHIALGVCYYPEQWPRTMWQSDLRRMKAHGIETVRVFEFAWSVIDLRTIPGISRCLTSSFRWRQRKRCRSLWEHPPPRRLPG